MAEEYKVHLESDSGYYPCGATHPHHTSRSRDEVTCHFCRRLADEQADPEYQRRLAESIARSEKYHAPD